ncbi:MAG: hypothetical protein WA970_08770 [Gammaproteobacteria bacterium]
MRIARAFALMLGLLGGWSGQAGETGGDTLAGSWFVDVIPQPEPPEVPEPPPPFVSILNFGLAGTVVETDTSLSNNMLLDLFPPEVSPPFTASDGYGSWKRTGLNRFRCTVIKFMFDEGGVPLGMINTTLDLVMKEDGRLEGEGASDFIEGFDPEGEVFFTGEVILEGRRLEVEGQGTE